MLHDVMKLLMKRWNYIFAVLIIITSIILIRSHLTQSVYLPYTLPHGLTALLMVFATFVKELDLSPGSSSSKGLSLGYLLFFLLYGIKVLLISCKKIAKFEWFCRILFYFVWLWMIVILNTLKSLTGQTLIWLNYAKILLLVLQRQVSTTFSIFFEWNI